MIRFKTISAKNFLSIGNKTVSFTYDSPITIVAGKNGDGKSTLFSDVLYFVLYGKSFRKVNLGNLVNSLNKSNLETECTFSIGHNEYRIRRGLRPNYFEIYVNDVLKPLPPNMKDYQQFFVKEILKMDERTFRQLVIIGSSSYIPFMRLNPADRRAVVEDLLRIDVFSQMLQQSKVVLNTISYDISNVESDIATLSTEINVRKSTSIDLKDSIKRNIEELDNTIKNIFLEISSLKTKKESLTQEFSVESVKQIQKTIQESQKKLKQLEQFKTKKQAVADQTQSLVTFFAENTSCPTCTQDISSSLKEEKMKDLYEKSEKHAADLLLFEEKQIELESNIKTDMEVLKELRIIYSTITSIDTEIQQNNSLIASYKESKLKLKDELKRAMNNVQSNITDLQDNINNLEKTNTELKEKLAAARLVTGLLKDDGVKKIIIRNYIPIINNLVKKYLDVIGFNIGFEFDEQFSETIKSRNRDVFEYENFSQGERLRIDHAILFAFRELAKIRSSISTNLLILDESDGGVLDEEGFQAVKDILSTVVNENVILISHSYDKLMDIATKLVIVKKINYFTELHIE